MTRNPIIVKLGGALLDTDLSEFWEQIKCLQATAPVILVHGGGPQATDLAARLGHSPRIVEGRRVTGDIDLEIILYTMSGLLNTRLVAEAGVSGIAAVGLTGADGRLIQVRRRKPWIVKGERVDFGHVGDVDRIEVSVLDRMLEGNLLPIISPPGVDREGRLFNVNADTVAAEIAVAVSASELIFVTDSSGVRRGTDPVGIISELDPTTLEEGLAEGWIHSGMKVKIGVGMEALNRGVNSVRIAGFNNLVDRKMSTRLTMQEIAV